MHGTRQGQGSHSGQRVLPEWMSMGGITEDAMGFVLLYVYPNRCQCGSLGRENSQFLRFGQSRKVDGVGRA